MRPRTRRHKTRGLTEKEARVLADELSDALNPDKRPGRCRSLADMTPEEQARMRELYERGRTR